MTTLSVIRARAALMRPPRSASTIFGIVLVCGPKLRLFGPRLAEQQHRCNQKPVPGEALEFPQLTGHPSAHKLDCCLHISFGRASMAAAGRPHDGGPSSATCHQHVLFLDLSSTPPSQPCGLHLWLRDLSWVRWTGRSLRSCFACLSERASRVLWGSFGLVAELLPFRQHLPHHSFVWCMCSCLSVGLPHSLLPDPQLVAP